MLRLVAENAALEDALYYLDLGVTDSVITVDVFLREIRRLARKQFVARATMKKVERAQHALNAQRANFNAQQQHQQAASRASGGYYPHLPPQQQQQHQQPAARGGSAAYMGGPPPVYTPPTGNYPGAGTYGGAAAGTAGGMGYGYPSYGGAQTPYTQRR